MKEKINMFFSYVKTIGKWYLVVIWFLSLIILLSISILLAWVIENYIKERKIFQENLQKQEISYYNDLITQAYNINGCSELIDIYSQEKKLKKSYLPTTEIQNAIELCEEDILSIHTTFSTWSFFDPRNNFLSTVNINFLQNFYEDIWEEWSEEFIQNRSQAKKELLSLVDIEPKVELKEESIVFYPNRAILYLGLEELSEYTITISGKKLSSWLILGEKNISFTTPESKYLKIFIKNPVSLYQDNHPPKFELVEYKSNLEGVWVKICRVDNEVYAKIEQLREQIRHPETKKFFIEKIDELKTFECFTKELRLDQRQENGSMIVDFDFDDIIGNPARSWLYFVTFEDTKLRDFNQSLQYALFFGIIDSHLTMKISKNGEWFFFVNDFDWKPLSNQSIRAYKNEFTLFENKWNRESREYEKQYFPVFEKDILSKPVELWKTDKNGILQVDLNKSFQNAFDLTFEDRWLENDQGQYPSVFVTSASNKHLSYNSSRWNAGIAPFNFGYKIGDYWWDDENSSQDKDKVTLDRWQQYPKYLSHTFTDRVLYLPWEEVYLKSILRKTTSNLAVEKNKDFVLKINNPKWKEVFSKNLKTNDFWSIHTTFTLDTTASLWSYYVYVMDGDIQVWDTSFSVEIFQNPKFKNDIFLETIWLTWDFFTVKDTINIDNWGQQYSWNFEIKGQILSSYYNGNPLKKVDVDYKVYKQYYYDNSYWDNCYYGCYYEWEKEFYTEGTTKTDNFWKAEFQIKIDHKTSYDDYKYIVEATITDEIWDKISWANSIIVKLPKEYKTWNPSVSIQLETKKNFYEVWEDIALNFKINSWDWDKNYDNKYLLITKKKDFKTEIIMDSLWIEKPINKQQENIINMQYVTSSLSYKPDTTWEYIFEYAMINEKDREKIEKIIWEKNFDDFKNGFLGKRDFKSLIIYWKENASNPVINDNKVQILQEKVSYHLWEKARFLIRLPFSKGKILWTLEKSWVLESEYIDVNSNIFFKEVTLDDRFVPNAYISVLAFPTENDKIQQYKVWYAEIVIDKTDKKSFVEIKPNKEKYLPREKVTLDIKIDDKNQNWVPSEITLMVIDDSIISLMWNIDLNLIDKFFKKLPFQIQTSLTNIAMLQNNYFSRPWIVWGSWFGSFKWGDSAVSTRTIFKNTAYYNSSIITDQNWKAKVSFDLPDNITNFRIIALSNSKNNMFWVWEQFIEVRKNVVVEPKTPMVVRNWDVLKVDTQIFNMTNKEIWFKVEFKSDDFEVKNSIQNINIQWDKSEIVSFEIENKVIKENLYYTISALWDSVENSDKFEWVIKIPTDPIMLGYSNKEIVIDEKNKTWNIFLPLPENTDLKNSKIILKISNNKLSWVEKIVSSLAKYPYWCVEQTTSSTFPNIVVKNLSSIFSGIVDEKEIDKNIAYWVERIKSMQHESWWFVYWPWDSQVDATITPYIYRTFYEVKKLWYKDIDEMLKNAKKYLEKNISNTTDDTKKSQSYWALSLEKSDKINVKDTINKLKTDLNTISRIWYTYTLINLDKTKYKSQINASIDMLKSMLDNDENSYRYRDSLWNKAIFTQMLLDYDYDINYINTLIDDLYSKDWQSYYYSTQTKNNAFFAFYKYLQKNWVNNSAKVKYSFNNTTEYTLVWEENPAILKKEFPASDIYNWENFSLDFDLERWKIAYIDVMLETYPEDIKKVNPYSNNIKVSRVFYELDSGKEIKWNTFKKWQMYRVVLDVETQWNQKELRNLVIEDYQSAWLKSINERLKINSNILNNQENWYFTYKEQRPEVVFLHSSYSYWKLEYTYLVRAEYEGIFTLPPVSAYLMYEPEIRTNSEYRVIEVVE